MQSFYPNCPVDLQDECVVEISAEQLIVKYVHKGKLVEYIGVAEGEGHYLIKGRGFEAEATLHHNGGQDPGRELETRPTIWDVADLP